jgi:polar amino acid transport system substrate-binding protein
MLDDGVYASVSDIGEAENISKSYVSRVLRLALLAPDIVDCILARGPSAGSGSERRCRRSDRTRTIKHLVHRYEDEKVGGLLLHPPMLHSLHGPVDGACRGARGVRYREANKMHHPGITSRRTGRALTFGAVLTLALAVADEQSAQADLLEEIKQRGTFVVGTEARFPPFEFVEGGEIVGYSADMMEHIMEGLPGVSLEQLDLPWQGILPGLAAKRFDYVITSVTVTKERYDAYHLSLPIADATMAVIKRKGDDSIGSAQDVAGKVVGSQAGSAQLQALEALAAELEEAGTPVADIRTYVDFGEAYADLAAGRLAAVVNSLPNQLEAARQRPDVFEVVLPTFGPKKYFSWAGRKDEESASLNTFMDEQIRRLNESGVLAELQRKWFGDVMELPSDELPEPAE